MRRVIIEAILLSILMTGVWWVTDDLTARTTIAGGRLLHDSVGYPAPGMARGAHLFWMSPLFPPLVGLLLASRWVPWRRRLYGLLITLAAFWYLVSFQVAVTFSPYLTLTTFRAYMMDVQVSANQVAVPILLWLIVAGAPPRSYFTTGRHTKAAPAKDGGAVQPSKPGGVHLLLAVILCGALCLVATLPVQLAVEKTNPALSAARKHVARAILAEDYADADKAIDELLVYQQPKGNSNLSLLQMEVRRLAARSRPR